MEILTKYKKFISDQDYLLLSKKLSKWEFRFEKCQTLSNLNNITCIIYPESETASINISEAESSDQETCCCSGYSCDCGFY